MQLLRNHEERRRKAGETVTAAGDTKDVYPPVATIYFLGYRLSEGVRKLLIKAGGGCVDMIEGMLLDGTNDDFIQCLTVTSYIIQLPAVPKNPTTDVDQVLGLFSELDAHTREIHVELPATEPTGSLLWRMVKRLALAAADPDLRKQMEDEELFEKSMRQQGQDQHIKEEQALEQLAEARISQAAAVAEKQTALAEKQTALEREKAALEEKQTAVEREKTAMAEKQIALEREKTAMAEKQAAIAEAASMQMKLARFMASMGKSADEIARDLGITPEVCRTLL
jgi:hypothetical protein